MTTPVGNRPTARRNTPVSTVTPGFQNTPRTLPKALSGLWSDQPSPDNHAGQRRPVSKDAPGRWPQARTAEAGASGRPAHVARSVSTARRGELLAHRISLTASRCTGGQGVLAPAAGTASTAPLLIGVVLGIVVGRPPRAAGAASRVDGVAGGAGGRACLGRRMSTTSSSASVAGPHERAGRGSSDALREVQDARRVVRDAQRAVQDARRGVQDARRAAQGARQRAQSARQAAQDARQAAQARQRPA